MYIVKRLSIVVTTAILSGCVAQAIEKTGYNEWSYADALYRRVRYTSGGTEQACLEIDRYLPLARSIESILFNESTAEAAARRQQCQATAMQREQSLSLLKQNCGCRRTRVVTTLNYPEEPKEPGGPRRRSVTDGFAASGVPQFYVTDEGHRGVDHDLGGSDSESHPETYSPARQRDKGAFASSSIKPDWQFSDLVAVGTCEPDDDADLGQCQALLSSVGRDNAELKECAADPDGINESASISRNQSEYASTIIEAHAACTVLRDNGELPPDNNIPDYPNYDQDPSSGGDYGVPDYDETG